MIRIKNYKAPEFNFAEILRYAGCKSAAADISELIEECAAEAADKLSYRVCYDLYDIRREDGFLYFGTVKTDSQTLKTAFKDCNKLLVFGATVGAEVDRMILKYSRIAPSKALIMQAIGTERIESLCDMLCGEISDELRAQNYVLKPRVSPGYGDIPLDMQRELFGMLDCSRKIGLTLNPQLIMSPSKSVTALAGIGKTAENSANKCDKCGKNDCEFRVRQ